jgi:GTPase SAR1 family protein
MVEYKEGQEMARKLQTLFLECSAKTKVGVEKAFEELVTKVKKKKGPDLLGLKIISKSKSDCVHFYFYPFSYLCISLDNRNA